MIKQMERLESSQSRLIECIQHTGIRGRDGVVRRATKEQIEQMKQGLSGMNEPSKPARDWSVPQAFTMGHKIPMGAEVEDI